MQLQYRLTNKDYLEAQALHAKGGIFRLIWRLVINFIAPAFGVFHWIVVFTVANVDHFARFDWTGFAFGAFWIAFPFIYRWLLILEFRRPRTQSGDSALSFDSDLIRYEGEHTKGEMEWKAIRSFSEYKKLFLLYMAPR